MIFVGSFICVLCYLNFVFYFELFRTETFFLKHKLIYAQTVFKFCFLFCLTETYSERLKKSINLKHISEWKPDRSGDDKVIWGCPSVYEWISSKNRSWFWIPRNWFSELNCIGRTWENMEVVWSSGDCLFEFVCLSEFVWVF